MEGAQMDRLPIDLLANIFILINSLVDLAHASNVCRKWKEGVKQSFARRNSLSFSVLKMNDHSAARIVHNAYSLKELDISRFRMGWLITDNVLCEISLARCINNLTSISLTRMNRITDKEVVQLMSRANSLQHLDVGGTFITDESLVAIADSCQQLNSINLRRCHKLTEVGLVYLVNRCRKLEFINAWEIRVPADCFANLLIINPALRLKQGGFPRGIVRAMFSPIV